MAIKRAHRFKPCATTGCNGRVAHVDYCRNCTKRIQRHGSAGYVKAPNGAPLKSRLDRLSMVDPATGCWVWQGMRAKGGYGYMGADGYAHRVAYKEYVGPVPQGLELDHLCNRPECVNPEHLEPVTHAENMRRMRDRLGVIA